MLKNLVYKNRTKLFLPLKFFWPKYFQDNFFASSFPQEFYSPTELSKNWFWVYLGVAIQNWTELVAFVRVGESITKDPKQCHFLETGSSIFNIQGICIKSEIEKFLVRNGLNFHMHNFSIFRVRIKTDRKAYSFNALFISLKSLQETRIPLKMGVLNLGQNRSKQSKCQKNYVEYGQLGTMVQTQNCQMKLAKCKGTTYLGVSSEKKLYLLVGP